MTSVQSVMNEQNRKQKSYMSTVSLSKSEKRDMIATLMNIARAIEKMAIKVALDDDSKRI